MEPTPSTPPLDPDGPLWRFALAFYARPGVAESCLALQAELGLDVNLLLLALYAHRERGVALGPTALTAADAAVAPWHREIVRTLRAVRTRLKAGPAPAPSPLTEELRAGVKAAELKAEQIELAALGAWLDAQDPTSHLEGTIETVLADLTRHAGARQYSGAVAAALATLAGALRRFP